MVHCGCVYVRCLKRLSYGKLRAIISDNNGGRHQWIDAIEGLLDHTFERIGPNAPPSAALIETALAPLGFHNHTFEPQCKLGQKLVREGRLHLINPPYEFFRDTVVIETANPTVGTLTSNDTRAYASEVFKYMSCEWDYVAGDKIIFTHLDKNTRRFLGKPYGGGKWSSTFKNRFKHGRAPSCKVSCCHMNPSLPPLLTAYLPRVCRTTRV